ncbi:MAG: hypothetical protein OXH52_22395 [Gammaproteobacteria bacterium]|nr:hypothetical protein [Gammaproteobacteria bacterium]
MKVRTLVYAVAAVIVGGLLGSLMLKDAGYVLIAYDKAAFETSVWFALIALVLLWVLARLLFALARRLLRGGADFANWRQKRRETTANERTEQGVLHILEGRWADARKALTEVASSAPTPIVNYLGAARAAHELKDADERDRLLDLAGGAASGASLAVGLTRARFLAEHGQMQECLETLEGLNEASPRHPRVMSMLLACHEELGDWDAVVELAPVIGKAKAVDPSDLEQSLQHAWCGRLEASSASADAAQNVRETWREIPRRLKRTGAVAVRYAQCLDAVGEADVAARILRRAIERDPDDRLIELYGEIRSGRPGEQLAAAEKWLEHTPRDPVLLQTLVRLSLLNEEWAKAKRYVELGATARTPTSGAESTE